jgi:hypothetical protein
MPAKALGVVEARAPVLQRCQDERMLAVEESRDQDPPPPAQLPAGIDDEQPRLDRRGLAARERHAERERLSDRHGALRLHDERVPLGIGGEIDEHVPDARGRGVDLTAV